MGLGARSAIAHTFRIFSLIHPRNYQATWKGRSLTSNSLFSTPVALTRSSFEMKQHNYLQNSNSSCDTNCLWAVCVSKQSDIFQLCNIRGERRWLLYVVSKFNEVWFTNPWVPSRANTSSL